MTRKGIVTALHGNSAVVAFGLAACCIGRTADELGREDYRGAVEADDPVGVVVGDEVEIAIPERLQVGGSLLVFVVPVGLAVVGALIGSILGTNLAVGIGAGVGLFGGLVLGIVLGRRLGRETGTQGTILRVVGHAH